VRPQELHDQPQLLPAEERLDCPNDAGLTADVDLLSHLEWVVLGQPSGCDDRVAAPKLVAVDRHIGKRADRSDGDRA